MTRGELEGRSFGGIGAILREQFTATVQDEHFANKVPDLVRFSDAFPPAGSGQAMRRERKRVAELEYSPT